MAEAALTAEQCQAVVAIVEPLLVGEIWRIMFGYYIHPSAIQPAEEGHILLVASYQR